MTKTRLFLMRHGQTLFNKQGRIQGWSDSPLTELGQKQAVEAGSYLCAKGYHFDAYYCSTSERTSHTWSLRQGRKIISNSRD